MTQETAPVGVFLLCGPTAGVIVRVLLGLLSGGVPAMAADVDLYAVVKTHHFTQESPGNPVIAPVNAYSFQSVVYSTITNAVTNATVRTPKYLDRTLTPQSGLTLLWEERFNSSAAMDFVYPHVGFTTYTFTMSTANDGVQVHGISYTFTASYPVTPQVLNWQAGQAIDHTLDFDLHWNDLGGDPSSPVGLVIREETGDVVYATPLPFATNALNGASNDVVIPAYALSPDTTYLAALSVGQVGGIPNTNYALGAAALARETQFPLQTLPSPIPPSLDLVADDEGGLEVILTGESNRTYQILSTTNGNDWESLLITNSVSGEVRFPDPQGQSLPKRFYRGQVGQ